MGFNGRDLFWRDAPQHAAEACAALARAGCSCPAAARPELPGQDRPQRGPGRFLRARTARFMQPDNMPNGS